MCLFHFASYTETSTIHEIQIYKQMAGTLEPLDCRKLNGDFRTLTVPFWCARSGVRIKDCYY